MNEQQSHNEETVRKNVSMPQWYWDALDRVMLQNGYTNRSEYLRMIVRDHIKDHDTTIWRKHVESLLHREGESDELQSG